MSLISRRPQKGVYPRTGGGNRRQPAPRGIATGLSPHGRGKPGLGFGFEVHSRSIPARAGETSPHYGGGNFQKVYPRTGGGNHGRVAKPDYIGGLSPHGRGKLSVCRWLSARMRSIPARAGETRRYKGGHQPEEVYPRTGGGNILTGWGGRGNGGLSPHGRGKLHKGQRKLMVCRSIPARAGETRCGAEGLGPGQVYPRTGGGNAMQVEGSWRAMGLSPHGRGKQSMPSFLS